MTLEEELLIAADLGAALECQRLIERNAYIHTRNRFGSTPLNEACVQGHTPVVGLLLRAGADPNVPDFDLRTPLHRCAFHNWLLCVPLLLDFGADATLKDESGRTPVECAITEHMKKVIQEFPQEKTASLVFELDKKREEREKTEAERCRQKAEEEEKAKEEEAQKRAQKEKRDGKLEEKKRIMEEKRKELVEEQKRKEREAESNLVSVSGRPDMYVTQCVHKQANGRYVEVERNEYRVELRKNGDSRCRITWSSFHDEWRLMCTNFKGGQALYRNPQKLFQNEVPYDGWIIWFGHSPAPSFSFSPPEGWTEDNEDEESLTSPTSASPSSSPKSLLTSSLTPTRKKTTDGGMEYLECSSALRIVPEVEEPKLLPQRGEIEEIKRDEDEETQVKVVEGSCEVHEDEKNEENSCDGTPNYDTVITECDAALQADPGDVKAQYKRACALYVQGEYERAFTDISNVLAHYKKAHLGSNPQVMKLRDNIIKELKREKEMWKGKRAERMWNRTAISAQDEAADCTPLMVVKTKPKAKWTPADVEKYLENKKTGAEFWEHFCSFDIFKQAYTKVSMSVDAFGHLLQVLPDANFDENTKAAYLEVALKTLSPTMLMMLSSKEQELLNTLDTRGFAKSKT